MVHGTNALTYAGASIPRRAGVALIVLTCVRLNAAYRVSVCFGSTGAEVDELSQSFESEAQARNVFDSATLLFSNGRTIASVLDDLAAIQAGADHEARLGQLRDYLIASLTVPDPAERTWRDAERFLASLAEDPNQPSLFGGAA